MHVQGQTGCLAQGLHDRDANGDVGDKVAVHDIHMDYVGPALLYQAYLFAQPREVRGQNRRGDLNACVLHGCTNFSTGV